MATFAENEIEILRDYLPGESEQEIKVLDKLRSALKSSIINVLFDPGVTTDPLLQQQIKKAQSINNARESFLRFIHAVHGKPDSPVNSSVSRLLREIYTQMKHRQFNRALADIDKIAKITFTLPKLTEAIIKTALDPKSIRFPVIQDFPDLDKPPIKKFVTLPGYTGPKLTEAESRQLLGLHAFVTGGAERRFRLALLRAECHLGLARSGASTEEFLKAIEEFSALLPEDLLNPPEIDDPLINDKPLTTFQKFIAIRNAVAHLNLGDALFRRSFRLNASERAEVAKVYDTAMRLVVRSGISPENPLRVDTIDYASQQKSKLKDALNFLGYHDSHVPDSSLSELERQADRRIKAAAEARGLFDTFKTRADALADELAKLSFDEKNEKIGVNIALSGIAVAEDKLEQANRVVDQLKTQEASLPFQLTGKLMTSLMQMSASSLDDSGDGASDKNAPGFIGVITALVGYFAQKNELGNQIPMAELAQRIASREELIARLESRIAQRRFEFVERLLEAKKLGSFNAERFFALANIFEDLTRHHVDVALEKLYLFERAIAFRRLKSLRIVEPKATSIDPLLAPEELERLRLDLIDAAEADGTGQNSFALPPWSLREHHPIEFSQFVQTGSMDFALSLYDVEKLLHGTFNIRIKKIGVEIVPPPPPNGFTGRLIHRGTTLVRDRFLTLNPPSSRLVPTEAQVKQAIARLESGKQDQAHAEGVVVLALGESALQITSEPDVTIPGVDQQFDLTPIENYGLPGSWHLAIEGIDLRQITDVRLKFVVSIPEGDSELDKHVVNLIDAYETELAEGNALDRITAFSLRQRFADAFFQLETGQGSFVLRDQDFPAGMTNLKVKAVIAQALGREGEGVEGIALEITQLETSLSFTGTTVADGFSVNLNGEIPIVPPSNRPPVLGTWQLRLLDPAQFARLDDVRLFFLYEFTPV